jgi:polyisoprenoid-binding protein YceI
MKKLFYPLAIIITISLSAFAFYASVNWKIADGYSVKFTSADPSGAFTSLKGDISFDEADLTHSKINVSVDVNSINTGNGKKNNDAKGPGWFDAGTYPEIKFSSTAINKAGGNYEAKGNLSMHGVTKEITIPFTFSKNEKGGVFAGSFSVNRKDFKLGENNGHAADVLKIDLSVPVTK